MAISAVTHPAYSNGPPGGSRGQFVQYQRRQSDLCFVIKRRECCGQCKSEVLYGGFCTGGFRTEQPELWVFIAKTPYTYICSKFPEEVQRGRIRAEWFPVYREVVYPVSHSKERRSIQKQSRADFCDSKEAKLMKLGFPDVGDPALSGGKQKNNRNQSPTRQLQSIYCQHALCEASAENSSLVYLEVWRNTSCSEVNILSARESNSSPSLANLSSSFRILEKVRHGSTRFG